MEDTRLVFSNIMENLLKQAKKNKNVLEYKDVNDAFKDITLTPEKFEWILDYFEKQGVDVLTLTKMTQKMMNSSMIMKRLRLSMIRTFSKVSA